MLTFSWLWLLLLPLIGLAFADGDDPPAGDPPADPASGDPPANPEPGEGGGGKLFAGKYDDPDQLINGLQSIREKQGLGKIEGKVYGKDGYYSDIKAVERAYKEHETLLGRMGSQQQTQQQQAKPAENKPGDGDGDPMKIASQPEQTTGDESVDSILQKAQLSAEDLTQQWQSEGKLTDEQYQALGKQGFPKAAVDAYLQGQQAQAQLMQQTQQGMRQQAAELAGGDQQLDTLLSTAKDFVPADEIDDLNQRLANPKQFKGAIRDLMDFHKQAVGAGKSQPMINGQPGPSTPSTPKTLGEFNKLARKAAAGDEAARKIVEQTDVSKFQ